MATPKTFTDLSTALDEANLNLLVRGGKLQIKVNYVGVLFTASTNAITVAASMDSDGEIVAADMVWNAAFTRIDVTLSGFVLFPIAFVQLADVGASTNVEDMWVDVVSATSAQVTFRGTGAAPAKVDPDGDVNFQLFIIGA